MTVPCFQYWRLRVTENYGGDTVKIDAISFLGRSGGDPISIDGEAIANAGDATGAFSGGAGWVISANNEKGGYFAIGTLTNNANDETFVVDSQSFSFLEQLNLDAAQTASYSVKFSPDGQYLAVYVQDSVIPFVIVETTNWTIIKSFTSPGDFGNSQGYHAIAWSPDSRYVACAGDTTDAIKVFDSQASWANVYSGTYSPLETSGVFYSYQLDWHPSGNYLVYAAADYSMLVMFDTSDWSQVTITAPSFQYDGSIYFDYFIGAQFSADGSKIYAVFYSSNINSDRLVVIDQATGWTESEVFTLSGNSGGGSIGVYFSPDNNYFVVGEYAPNAHVLGMRLWDFSTGTPVIQSVSGVTANIFLYSYGTPAVSWKADNSGFLFAGTIQAGGGGIYSVDISTLTATLISSLNATISDFVYSVDIAPYFPPAPAGGGAIGYKFALPVTPTHIDITASGTSRPKTGVVEYSEDGRTWYPLQTLGFS